MNIQNFVVDKVRHGMGFDRATGEMLWHLTEVQNPTLGSSAESKNALGADGTPIMTLYTQKTGRFSAESALLDFTLMAAQYGTSLEKASSTAKIIMPMVEEFTVKASQTTVKLAHKPNGELKFIYRQNPGQLAERCTADTTAAAAKFKLDASSQTITLPTDAVAGDVFFVYYEYEAEDGVRILNSAANFPRACKFVLDVLGHDICNKDIMYSAKIVFPNAQLSPNVDITLATDGNHPFELEAQQEYCSTDKGLFEIYVPDADEDTAE